MKKSFKKITALSLSLLMGAVYPVTSAYAAESQHEIYLSAEGTDKTDTGEVFYLERSMLGDDGYTLKINIFYRDDALDTWYISPKVKCADQNIKLRNLVDPKEPLIEFAYAETNEAGELYYGSNSTLASGSEVYNTVNFTCMNSSLMNRTAMKPYGEYTDSYPLTSFDAIVSKEIPTGEYNIYFLTEAEDEPDQRVTEISLMIDGGPEPCTDTALTNMKIVVSSLGDIDDNGIVDSNDASAILKEYSLLSTKKSPSFDAPKNYAADVNKDGKVDANDASLMLKYYAYVSTNDFISFIEYVSLENNNQSDDNQEGQ